MSWNSINHGLIKSAKIITSKETGQIAMVAELKQMDMIRTM
jgi:hypothetical protein